MALQPSSDCARLSLTDADWHKTLKARLPSCASQLRRSLLHAVTSPY